MLLRGLKKLLWTLCHFKSSQLSSLCGLNRSTPYTPRVPSTLRQKMASFQTLMDVEESDACDPKPAQDGSGGGCIKTRDYLSDGNSHGAGKENNPPVTPTPSKRRRLGPLEVCDEEIREAGAPILLSTLKEHKVTGDPVTRGAIQRQRSSEETAGGSEAVLTSQLGDVNFQLTSSSPPRTHQDGVFEARSPRRPPPVDPAAASPPQLSSPFLISSLPPLLERRPTDVNGTPSLKKKQVRFGGPLSPELYDKSLPSNTPLQRGGTPARAPTPGGSLQMRSLLKTPQGSTSKMSHSQLDLDSPTEFGASPTFSISRRRGSEIVFPSVEDIDSPTTNETEYMWDAQPLNLDKAFQEESLAESMTAQNISSDLETTVCQMEDPDEPASCPQEDQQPDAGVEDPAPGRSRNRRVKLQGGSKQKPARKAPARPGGRKKKASSAFPQQPKESGPVKRSTRSAAKSASGKMKMSAAAARRWNKDVDRSLYGSRTYASKNPELSPITERSSSISDSPATHQTPSADLSATSEDQPNLESAGDTPTSSKCCDEDAAGRSEVGGRRTSRNVADTDLLSEDAPARRRGEGISCTVNFNASPGDPSNSNAPLGALISEYAPSSDSDGKCDIAATSDCAPTGEESDCTNPAPKKVRRGRRSKANVTVLQEQQNHAGERQTSREVENEQVGQQENLQSSSVSHEERGASSQVLAPWQADFNFEDVFKPIATRRQRSVRRSLRNRCDDASAEGDRAGLAWLPRTSPDNCRETRRKTRGRRPSAAPPDEPSPQHAP